MLKKEILSALNKQIQVEFNNAYAYLSLANWFENQTLKGFAAWFRKQFNEEQTHAFKLRDYVLDRGGEIELGPINPLKKACTSTLECMKYALQAEQTNTANINALAQLAAKEGDLATVQMLQWFINEQVEEEKWAMEYVAIAEKIGSSVGSLYMFDHRVAKAAAKE